MGKAILVYKPPVALSYVVARVKKGSGWKMRMRRREEHYSALLMKRFATVMFADHLNLLAGCRHTETCQGLEVLLRAGAEGQRFGTRVHAEREETAAGECIS